MGTRDCKHISAMASPAVGEVGKTGEWRQLRPVIDYSKCLAAKKNKPHCFLCWLYCPEVVIKKAIPIEIDLTYCKGCGICAEECPAGAITMVAENASRDQDRPTNVE